MSIRRVKVDDVENLGEQVLIKRRKEDDEEMMTTDVEKRTTERVSDGLYNF